MIRERCFVAAAMPSQVSVQRGKGGRMIHTHYRALQQTLRMPYKVYHLIMTHLKVVNSVVGP